jgi:hypothetical protein
MAVAITDIATEADRIWHPFWHRSAPRRLVEDSGDDPTANWAPWQLHLARRKRPATPPFLKGKSPPLWWATEPISEVKLPAIRDMLASVGRASDAPAWWALAAAYSLPDASASLAPAAWWELVERLRTLAIDADLLAVDPEGDPQDLLRQQLLAGELPLVLGYLFPEVQSLRELRDSAREALSEALVEWTDGQGLPHGRLLPVLGPLWASWTRCRWMGQRLKRGCWSREAEIQYQWLVRHAIRLTGVDGRFMLLGPDSIAATGNSSPAEWSRGLYATALDLVGDRADCAAAAAILPRRVVLRKIRAEKRDLPDVSLESEWSGLAVLATDWKRSAVRLAVSYAEEPMRIELSAGREQMLSGLWNCATTCDGEPVQFEGEWSQACWQSVGKCDYLELCAELSHALRLERQLILSRADRVVYLADVIISAEDTPRRLVHTIEFPLGPRAHWQPEEETRDGVLASGKQRSAVVPLALTEWHCDPRGGRLQAACGKLTLTQETHGRALYCPLFFDLDRRRTKKERTWRQLTVAEALIVVPRDVAVGYRAQIGRAQWLFYRSLAPAGNRTLLGQNIAGEFYAGRFRASGKLDEWIEIEAC